MSPDVSLVILAIVWFILLIGVWAEVFWLRSFKQWYFAWGPVVFRRHMVQPHPPSQEVATLLSKRFAVRRVGDGLLLLRRYGIPRLLDVPQLYASRLCVVISAGEVTIEARHPVSWPLILALPILHMLLWAIVGQNPSDLLIASPFLVVALLTIPSSLLLARRDVCRIACAFGAP